MTSGILCRSIAVAQREIGLTTQITRHQYHEAIGITKLNRVGLLKEFNSALEILWSSEMAARIVGSQYLWIKLRLNTQDCSDDSPTLNS